MNALKGLALVTLLAALGVIAWAAAEGAVRVLWVLFFPVVVGEGLAPFLGILLLFAAAVLWFAGAARDAAAAHEESGWVREARVEGPRGEDATRAPPERRTRGGGILILGPIPIVWGSDRSVTVTLLVLGILLTLLLVGLFVLGPRLRAA